MQKAKNVGGYWDKYGIMLRFADIDQRQIFVDKQIPNNNNNVNEPRKRHKTQEGENVQFSLAFGDVPGNPKGTIQREGGEGHLPALDRLNNPSLVASQLDRKISNDYLLQLFCWVAN
jgi:hypothetical protein